MRQGIDKIATIENCRYCLMCRHVAPVGHVMSEEAVTPHGIALVVASQRRGLIDWNEKSVRTVYAEPDGGNCRAHCITDQPLPAAIAAVRADIANRGLAPDIVYETRDRMAAAGSPYGEILPAAVASSGDVALYVGDEAHYLWPEAAIGASKLLQAAGQEHVLIGTGQSNGYTACSLGFPDMAREHSSKLLEEIRATGARTLIALSPGDMFVFRQLYPERLGVSWPEDVELVDLASFLSGRMEAGKLAFEPSRELASAAYVDPTHAVRVPERFTAVRTLVDAVVSGERVELFWRRERAHPVGSTALQFTRPDIADQLTRARLEDAKNQGAKVLFCEDPGTLFQLRRFADEMELEVRGLYETLAEQLC